ncbi:manganese efflux pump MntP family protein [Sphingomonadaceae bacterium jetA1]|uniref:manganese efflux pump MntP n=1 Tax=Facivitalis istanbulensis TaxID=3075838 RepID=UPI0034879B8E
MPGILTLGALGATLSVDAFAAALGRGATERRTGLPDAIKVGIVFGFFEALTPALGWLLGFMLNDWIAEYDHWVAFGLLFAVGAYMVREAWRDDGTGAGEAMPGGNGVLRLAVTAIATSIDAAAVGVTLALMNVDIWIACLVIGGTTTLMATVGVMLGKHIGPYLGRYAGIIGGFVLIGIGASILAQHLSV